MAHRQPVAMPLPFVTHESSTGEERTVRGGNAMRDLQAAGVSHLQVQNGTSDPFKPSVIRAGATPGVNLRMAPALTCLCAAVLMQCAHIPLPRVARSCAGAVLRHGGSPEAGRSCFLRPQRAVTGFAFMTCRREPREAQKLDGDGASGRQREPHLWLR